MSLTKRLYMPEIYEEIDGIRAELPDDLPEEYVTPQELLMEQAEILRDSMREDGINV